jgi:undecaprenyl-diphosphatase
MNFRWRNFRLPIGSFFEARTLMTLLAVVGALLLLAKLVDGIAEGETRAFDHAVLLAFRNPDNLAQPVGPVWLQIMFRDLTSLGSPTVVTLITAAVAGYLLIDGKRAAALLVLSSVAGGGVLSGLFKLGIERPRPDLVSHLVEVHTTSFPSGHATLSAVTYLTLGALLARVEARRRVKIYVLSLAVVITFLIGLSRIYLGVHWPTDIIAGWCVGAAWAMLCWRIALALQQRGEVEKDV